MNCPYDKNFRVNFKQDKTGGASIIQPFPKNSQQSFPQSVTSNCGIAKMQIKHDIQEVKAAYISMISTVIEQQILVCNEDKDK